MPIVNLISEKIRHVRMPKSGRNIDVFTALARAGAGSLRLKEAKHRIGFCVPGLWCKKRGAPGCASFD
jgi:hypothetical protein